MYKQLTSQTSQSITKTHEVDEEKSKRRLEPIYESDASTIQTWNEISGTDVWICAQYICTHVFLLFQKCDGAFFNFHFGLYMYMIYILKVTLGIASKSYFQVKKGGITDHKRPTNDYLCN